MNMRELFIAATEASSTELLIMHGIKSLEYKEGNRLAPKSYVAMTYRFTPPWNP